MFEKYMIVPTDVQNVVEGDKTTGFRFAARLPYYRGVSLSLVQDIGVTIAGQEIPRAALRLTVHGNTYSLAEMEAEGDDRWEMGEVAHISFPKENGLSPGEHTLALMINLRVAYLPFPAIRHAEKTITV